MTAGNKNASPRTNLLHDDVLPLCNNIVERCILFLHSILSPLPSTPSLQPGIQIARQIDCYPVTISFQFFLQSQTGAHANIGLELVI